MHTDARASAKVKFREVYRMLRSYKYALYCIDNLVDQNNILNVSSDKWGNIYSALRNDYFRSMDRCMYEAAYYAYTSTEGKPSEIRRYILRRRLGLKAVKS